jgi:predicted aldo/keto reductase-like oxidoreductase
VENQAGPRFAYDAFPLKAGSGADQCTECAEGAPKCPQHIPIIEMLAKAHAHLTGSCQNWTCVVSAAGPIE